MNFWNDKVIRDCIANFATKYKKVGLGDKIREIEDRLDKLETRKVGRPPKLLRKSDATND